VLDAGKVRKVRMRGESAKLIGTRPTATWRGTRQHPFTREAMIMPGVTISAGYGAGGSVVAPRLAQRLGFPLFDRAISSRIAHQLHVSVDEAECGGKKRSMAARFFGVLSPMAGGVIGVDDDGAPITLAPDDTEEFRERAEAIIGQALPTGVVVLGRAGAAMLAHEPDVLRVRLFGPEAARIQQAARVEGISVDDATTRLHEVDRARGHYVHRLYRRDIDDPALYHLQVDSTVVHLDGCVEVIAAAYAALIGHPEQAGGSTSSRSS
jgi:cytidylate kinase